MTRLPITPVAKPRMTQRDKWQKRPAVLLYRAYADQLRASVGTLDPGAYALVFQLPMPKSWPKKKRAQHDGKPHQSKPDLDNLIKAFFDPLMQDDSGVWKLTAEKQWATEGAVLYRRIP